VVYEIDGDQYPSDMKPSNPKDLVGSNKVPMGLVPGTTMAYLALGHLEGHMKYGLMNWREVGVRFSIYLDACLRHIQKLKDGEWADSETTVPHLANALCCLSILVDAYHSDKLIDDRPKSAPTSETIDQLAEVVTHLKKLHGDKKPIDYLITGPKQRE
jgi:dATP/dGTP diphosphohydrolase